MKSQLLITRPMRRLSLCLMLSIPIDPAIAATSGSTGSLLVSSASSTVTYPSVPQKTPLCFLSERHKGAKTRTLTSSRCLKIVDSRQQQKKKMRDLYLRLLLLVGGH